MIEKIQLDPILNDNETADALGISIRTLRRMRDRGEGPKRIQISRRRFGTRTSEVNAYKRQPADSEVT